ncbi:MAG: LytTR family DNA-binding domain-containing protein [Bacteroidales bacterium]|nr:LytTR family DNA-binding domain-containing protein [Bacteroidales bacterium]MCF8343778.1 LytTR family DNA-binding domain-containing protein [Bacteroidales bacterium]MCF8350298.1 LytTR family DNA-binding domain-containing protein [Bacteroidales bacterium]MCF8374737.1 LytTR family DNA-binding domain-containing protein [Bacteroidales bacterium]MCF8399859.1 LytTR family DNA-binding domain-containing protein [Bacteroidales bacterium]
MDEELIKTVIVDDESACRNSLKGLITDHCNNLEIVGEAGNIKMGQETIMEKKPGLVFLDVKLPDGTGFDMLDQIPSLDFKIIFVSAFDRYAINAFRFSAIDYLLKPIESEKLMRAVNRLYDSNLYSNFHRRIELMMANLHGFNKIALPTLEGFTFVNLLDIVRCESESNYTWFIMKDGSKILVSRSLKEYDEMLCAQGFFRSHKSHLINLNHVVKYQKGGGGSLSLDDGSTVEVSRRRKDELLDVLLRRKNY